MPLDRRVLALLLVLLMGAVAVTGLVIVPRVLGDDGAGPEDDAEAFLAAWSEGHLDEMATRVVDPPATFADDYTATMEGLQVESAEYRLTEVREDGGGDAAIAGFRATLRLTGLGEWAYDGSMRLQRGGGGDDAPDWLVEWSPGTIHPSLEDDQRLIRTRTWPERGAINGSDGEPLAPSVPGRVVGVQPSRVQDLPAVQRVLQEQLGVDPAAVQAAIDAPGVQPDHFVPIITITEERYLQVEPVVYPIPGTVFRDTTVRSGPTEGYAQHILGRTEEATAERLEELGDPYVVGDVVGVTGLEARFEQALAGTPSGEIQAVDAEDEVVATIDTIEGRAPAAVNTTIDRTVQTAVERTLGTGTAPAAIVVTDPEGNVRGAASRPLSEDLNRAFGGSYPPGSTFKIVTADALLGAGITPESPIECSETINAGGRSFRNFEGGALGIVPFGQAFAESCNTAMIRAAEPVQNPQLVEAAERFGFNAEYNVGLNTEGGSYPEPADATEKAAQAIGQGRIVASPLHMATVAGTVIDGSWEPPTLLVDPPELPAADGTEGATATTGADATATTAVGDAMATTGATTATTTPPDGAATAQPTTIDGGHRETLSGLMQRVVTEGSGTAAAVPGRTVAGKTGTAEFGEGDPLPTHAWFVGFSGNLAASVFLENGGVGGRDAAPIAGTLFAALPA